MDGERLCNRDVAGLVERLKDRLGSVGGLAIESERELARELVRRARREEKLRHALTQLLAVVEGLDLHQCAGRRWTTSLPRSSCWLDSAAPRQKIPPRF